MYPYCLLGYFTSLFKNFYFIIHLSIFYVFINILSFDENTILEGKVDQT